MNRERINKIADSLQIIEDFGKKYRPGYETGIVCTKSYDLEENLMIYFKNLLIEYNSVSVVLKFTENVDEDSHNPGDLCDVWGYAYFVNTNSDFHSDICKDDHTINLLSILDFVVEKIKEGKVEMEKEARVAIIDDSRY